jgi:hypothetical protein
MGSGEEDFFRLPFARVVIVFHQGNQFTLFIYPASPGGRQRWRLNTDSMPDGFNCSLFNSRAGQSDKASAAGINIDTNFRNQMTLEVYEVEQHPAR